MKKLSFLLFVTALACLVTGCRKPVEVSFGVSTQTIAVEGGSYTVELKSNGDWTIDLDSDWLTVSPTSGNGDATITIEAQPNPTDQVRSQEIKAYTKDNSATLTIDQESSASYITLLPNSMLGDYEGGKFQVVVQSNMMWKVTNLPEWVECSTMEGQGNDTLWMTMLVSHEPGNREADIAFGNENTFALFHVTQTGMGRFLNVTPTEIHVAYTGGVETLAVSCDESWMVFSGVDWVDFDKIEGEGDDAVVATIGANSDYVPRQASVKFVSDTLSFVVTINQEAAPDPHFLEVTPITLTFGKEGGSMDVTVGCDVEWSVDSQDAWLSLSTTGGTGNGSVRITAAPNALNESRETAVAVVSGNLSSRINVTQEPGDEPLVANVIPDTLFVASTGGRIVFDITSNTSWTLSWTSSWILLPIGSDSGSGDATIEMWTQPNDDHSNRIGRIAVMHNGVALANVVVVQEGIPAILTADVTELNFAANGGGLYFNLTSNLDWSIRSEAEWIVCDPSEGHGNKEVLVKVVPWSSSEPREATIVVMGEWGTTVSILVRQAN